MSSFSSLPSDILRYIVSFSDHTSWDVLYFSQVCKNWNTIFCKSSITDFSEGIECIAISPLLFTLNYIIGNRTQIIDFNRVRETNLQIAGRCPNLRCLRSKNSKFLTDDVFSEILRSCPFLSEISISSSNMTVKSFFEIGKNCKDLKNLELIFDDYNSHNFWYDEGLVEIFRNCLKMENLTIELNCHRSSNVFHEISRLKNLKQLSLKCYYINEETIGKIVSECSNIVNLYLGLGYCHDELYFKIADNLPNLEEINFHHTLSTHCITDCIRKFKKLKCINIYFRQYENRCESKYLIDISNCFELETIMICCYLTDEVFCRIIEGCQKLKNVYLNLHGLSEKSLCKLSSLKNLEILHITDHCLNKNWFIQTMNNCLRLNTILFGNRTFYLPEEIQEFENRYPKIRIKKCGLSF